jgi:hypothetical protein
MWALGVAPVTEWCISTARKFWLSCFDMEACVTRDATWQAFTHAQWGEAKNWNPCGSPLGLASVTRRFHSRVLQNNMRCSWGVRAWRKGEIFPIDSTHFFCHHGLLHARAHNRLLLFSFSPEKHLLVNPAREWFVLFITFWRSSVQSFYTISHHCLQSLHISCHPGLTRTCSTSL